MAGRTIDGLSVGSPLQRWEETVMTETTTSGPRPAEPGAAAEDSAIRPFQVNVSEEELADLRRRLALARWPSKELVADASQGVQLEMLQELGRYWAADYDWRRCEAKLNALPQLPPRSTGSTSTSSTSSHRTRTRCP
jgi:hypothetical protein